MTRTMLVVAVGLLCLAARIARANEGREALDALKAMAPAQRAGVPAAHPADAAIRWTDDGLRGPWRECKDSGNPGRLSRPLKTQLTPEELNSFLERAKRLMEHYPRGWLLSAQQGRFFREHEFTVVLKIKAAKPGLRITPMERELQHMLLTSKHKGWMGLLEDHYRVLFTIYPDGRLDPQVAVHVPSSGMERVGDHCYHSLEFSGVQEILWKEIALWSKMK